MSAAVRKLPAVVIVALAAVLAGTALAGQGDPQKKITAAGQARAHGAALRLADLGAGWKAGPVKKDDGASSPRCSTYNPDQSDLVEIGKYNSPDFTRADGSFVSSSTGVFRTVQGARAAYTRVAVPQIAGCFGEIFVKAIKKPTTASIALTGPLTFPKSGDRLNAYRIVMSLKTPTQMVPFTVDLVVFNKGATDVAMIFLGISKPLPAAFEQALVARVASRVQ
jgi:hypothetical protein